MDVIEVTRGYQCVLRQYLDVGADLLRDDALPCVGAEQLYLRTEDLAEGHIPEVERTPVSNNCSAQCSHRSCDAKAWAGKYIRHVVRHNWYEE
jgi:hypothetical protein